jgi:hypothetical protein
MKTDELKKLADVADRTASTGSYWNEREDFRIANDTSPVPPRCAGREQMNKKQAQEIVEKTDKETVKRLSRTMNWYSKHWKVEDSFSEQRAADCDKAADTLLTLLAALDAAEAEKRAAVAAAHEEAERRARYLAEYVEKVRAEAYREGWRFAHRQWGATGSVPDPDYLAAIRQETNDG